MTTSVPRVKLAHEVAKKLCEDIACRRWDSELPPERELCRTYVVSRRTLREALQMLFARDIIARQARRPPRIVRRKFSWEGVRTQTVAILSAFPLDLAEPEALRILQTVAARLQSQNIAVRFIVGAGYYSTGFRRLQKLVEGNRIDCWVIHRCPPAMQTFLVAGGYPVVLLGSTSDSPGLSLPCVDMDRHAAAYHAAGKLMQAGYRRICLFVPDENVFGDLACRRGFEEACDRCETSGTLSSEIITYRDEPTTIRKAVERIMRKSPASSERTGIIITRVRPSLMLLTHILSMGIRVPQHVGVLSTDWTPLFAYLSPSMAGYQVPYEQVARCLTGHILAVTHGETLRTPQQYLIPEYKAGTTCM